MIRRQDGPKQEEPASWLATFADLATLLFTFYCLIYASCTFRPGQWETAKSAIERMLAVLPGSSGTSLVAAHSEGPLLRYTAVVPLLGMGEGVGPGETPGVQEAWENIETIIEERGDQGGIEIDATEGGFVFRLASPVVFRLGEAALNPEVPSLLGSVAVLIRGKPCEVVVEGHTCDLPVHTGRFASNWDLSGARAAEVVRFLEGQGIGMATISARACGEFHPRVLNVDEEARRTNRRVEIQVSYAAYEGWAE